MAAHEAIRWARQQAYLPETTYATSMHVKGTAVAAIADLDRRFQEASAIAGFWDGDKPKREPRVHGLIHSHLDFLDVSKNIEISPEVKLGNGNLDFLLTGVLTSGERAHVCVEVKSSFSSDLEDGLTKQLPEYMRRKNAAHGIYCVLDYGPGYRPTKFEDGDQLRQWLEIQASYPGRPDIHVVVIGVHKTVSPSKL